MTAPGPTRRRLPATLGGLLALPALPRLLGGRPARAQAKPAPLRVLDTSESRFGPHMMEAFALENPGLVSELQLRHAHRQILFDEILREVEAGQPSADLVLCGLEGLLIGAELELWQPVVPLVQAQLPPLDELLQPLARSLRGIARDQGQVVLASPGGPLLTHVPDRVARMPRTAEELLDWAKQNPGRFLYARPDMSDAGKCFVSGLPWLLRDADPTDPEDGWPSSWAYLEELDRHIRYYPTTQQACAEELAEGRADIIATTIGFDVESRATGLLPRSTGLTALHGLRWVPVGLFLAVPAARPAARPGGGGGESHRPCAGPALSGAGLLARRHVARPGAARHHAGPGAPAHGRRAAPPGPPHHPGADRRTAPGHAPAAGGNAGDAAAMG